MVRDCAQEELGVPAWECAVEKGEGEAVQLAACETEGGEVNGGGDVG